MENDTWNEPILINASVGSGKSLIIAELLKHAESKKWRALCLTLNSTLISQNNDTYKLQGGKSGIYCAALGRKELRPPVIFASPLSVRNAINQKFKLSKIRFDIIVIDEAHNVNCSNKSTSFMMILTHYKKLNPWLKSIGLTGTPFRGRNKSIVGPAQYYKKELCAIDIEWLIANKFLTQPHWGYFPGDLNFDFSKVTINKTGKFNSQELEEVTHHEPRKTEIIMRQVIACVRKRKGAFIFASSVKHCYECASHLPKNEVGIIIGSTSDSERERLIGLASKGIIKYLVNVNVLCVGVDIPLFDTVVFVRPTESLILYTQCIGRGLRLHNEKKECLVLDYAGNLDRHGELDSPLINMALEEIRKQDPNYCISCPSCFTLNKPSSRRCIGIISGNRCEHYFQWKECIYCHNINSASAKECINCKKELVDPNDSLDTLAASKNLYEFNISKTSYSTRYLKNHPYFLVCYSRYGDIPMLEKYKQLRESFSLGTDEQLAWFMNNFLDDTYTESQITNEQAQSPEYLQKLIDNDLIKKPCKVWAYDDGSRLKVIKRQFDGKALDQQLKKLMVLNYDQDFTYNQKMIVTLDGYNEASEHEFLSAKIIFNLNTASSKAKLSRYFGVDLSGVPISKIKSNLYYPPTIDPKHMPEWVMINWHGTIISKSPSYKPPEWLYNSNLSNSEIRRENISEFNILKIRKTRYKTVTYHLYLTIKHNNEWRIRQTIIKLSEHELYLIESKKISKVRITPNGRYDLIVNEFVLITGEIIKKDYFIP